MNLKIKDILNCTNGKLIIGNEEKEYYVLSSINSYTTLFVPTNNLETLSKIKKILTKDEVKDYILNILKEDYVVRGKSWTII